MERRIFPGTGTEPMSPAVAGGVLSTAPPGESSSSLPGLAFSSVFIHRILGPFVRSLTLQYLPWTSQALCRAVSTLVLCADTLPLLQFFHLDVDKSSHQMAI